MKRFHGVTDPNTKYEGRRGGTFTSGGEKEWETLFGEQDECGGDGTGWTLMEPVSEMNVQEREGKPFLDATEDPYHIHTHLDGPVPKKVKDAHIFSLAARKEHEKRLREEEAKKREEKAKLSNRDKFQSENSARDKLEAIRRSPVTIVLAPEVKTMLEKEFAGLRRPPLKDIPKTGKWPLFFQDADYVTDWKRDRAPVIRIIGLTQEGNTVALCIERFKPYFYVLLPPSLVSRYIATGSEAALRSFGGSIDRAINMMNYQKNRSPNKMLQELSFVESVELVERYPFYRHQPKKRHYLKITTFQPAQVPFAKKALSEGWLDRNNNLINDETLEKDKVFYSIGEADIPFVLRFMVNKNMSGCGWFSVDMTKVTELNGQSIKQRTTVQEDPAKRARVGGDRFSRCQAELRVPESAIEAMPDKSDVPPLRLMAFDIECAGKDGRFPVAQLDPIICMSTILYRLQDRDKPMNKAVFCVGDTELSPGISKIQCGKGNPNPFKDKAEFARRLRQFCQENPNWQTDPKVDKKVTEMAAEGLERVWDQASETQMLLALREYIVEYADPDLLVGYNSGGFDHPYTFDRADHLKIGRTFRDMSRQVGEVSHVRDKLFESAAFGRRTNHELKCFGRHMFDVMLCAVRDIMLRLRIYNLNSVAFAVLKKTKHEVDHKDIEPMWVGVTSSAKTRKVVAEYCLNDSQITYEVLDKKCYYMNAQELARCSGVPLDYILYRGQSIKSVSCILREAAKEQMVLPTFVNRRKKFLTSGFAGDPNGTLPDDFDDRPTSLGSVSGPMLVEVKPQGDKRRPDLTEDDMAVIIRAQEEVGDFNIRLAQRVNRWATTLGNEQELRCAINEATLQGKNLYLFFLRFIKDKSSHNHQFYGYARVNLSKPMVPNDDPANPVPWHTIHGLAYGDLCELEWISIMPDYIEVPNASFNLSDMHTLPPAEANKLVLVANNKLFGPEENDKGPKAKKKKKAADDDDESDDDAVAAIREEADEFFESGADPSYTGAIVIDPIRGLYLVPVATLDFASLYPSLMIAHNLCHTCWLSKKQALRDFKPEDYEITPGGHYFLRASKKQGLLPRILVNYLKHRSAAKKELEKETDPFRKVVLDGRQNALKVSANSVYGFTGATVASLPCMPVSAGTTSYGRKALELVHEKVEQEFPLAKRFCFGPTPKDWLDLKQKLPDGVPADKPVNEFTARQKEIWDEALVQKTTDGMRPIVIAGDTDSVMVIFPHCTEMDDAMALGSESAKWITENYFKNQPPMNLAFEKIYCPGVWINRKRYAAVYWSEKNWREKKTFDKMDCKGIETVRRDNCPMVSEQMDRLLRTVLIDRKIVTAILDVAQTIASVREARIDPGLLVITKALSKKPEDYKPAQVHSKLALKMRRRDPLTAPKCGDRVAYVVIAGAPGAKTTDKGEDPVYMMHHHVPLDIDYYLNNQLRKPVCRILNVILPGIDKYLFDGQDLKTEKPLVNVPISAFFNGAGARQKVTEAELKLASRAGEKRKKKDEVDEEKERKESTYAPSNLTLRWAKKRSEVNIGEIQKGIAAKSTKQSFRGAHITDVSTLPVPGTKLIYKCERCKTPLSEDERGIVQCAVCYPSECDCEDRETRRRAPLFCDRCSRLTDSVDATLKPKLLERDKAKTRNQQVWDTCLKCMKVSQIEEVESCANQSCRNWYTRLKTRMDLAETSQALDRISYCQGANLMLKRVTAQIAEDPKK